MLTPLLLQPVALSALEVNMIRFPSQSRHITDQCLRWCLSTLDGRETVTKETVKVACQCLAALHHVNGKLNSSDQWKDNMLHLVGSVHLSLDRLFDTIDEGKLDGDAVLYQQTRMSNVFVTPDFMQR
jgi:hypothetical protein